MLVLEQADNIPRINLPNFTLLLLVSITSSQSKQCLKTEKQIPEVTELLNCVRLQVNYKGGAKLVTLPHLDLLTVSKGNVDTIPESRR